MVVLYVTAVLTLTLKFFTVEEPASPVDDGPNRVIINVQDPDAVRQWHQATKLSTAASVGESSEAKPVNQSDERGTRIAWESRVVLHSASGQDSFRVSSSRSGCPGIAVRPSIAVSFATSHGWSEPPIRFGPLTSQGICPLGGGMELEVRAVGGSAPIVKLVERQPQITER